MLINQNSCELRQTFSFYTPLTEAGFARLRTFLSEKGK